jgi:hypothetical protein
MYYAIYTAKFMKHYFLMWMTVYDILLKLNNYMSENTNFVTRNQSMILSIDKQQCSWHFKRVVLLFIRRISNYQNH